ncbi:MAG: DUF418 domain-containing protein [Gemmatimonadota bacterium]|nr:DUF418 domain-containing protein [Gemmatimonadota bacterium]MDE2872670.1 DUF418 domain-containing protein [Gemmatimonadota bacterium]
MLLWRAGGMMLVGMALYRLGVLAAARPAAWYRRMVLAGLSSGLPLAAAGTAYKIHAGFDWERAMFVGGLFNYVGSIGVFLAYFALVMLTVKAGRLPGLRNRLAAVGRMALTHVHEAAAHAGVSRRSSRSRARTYGHEQTRKTAGP